MREKTIENYFCQKIKEYGGNAYKLILFSGAGFPDRTVFLPDGKIFFVEFKVPGGKLSKLQKFWFKHLRNFGQNVFKCDSKERADFIISLVVSNEV